MRLSSSSDCMEVLGSHHCVILVAAVLFDVKLSLCALWSHGGRGSTEL